MMMMNGGSLSRKIGFYGYSSPRRKVRPAAVPSRPKPGPWHTASAKFGQVAH